MLCLSEVFRSLLFPIAIGVAVLVTSSISRSQQQNIQPLMDRLERLERDIRTLNIQLSRGDKLDLIASPSDNNSLSIPPGPATARLGARMDSFEADMRTSTGTIEFVNHQIIAINKRLEKLLGDIDYRFSVLEGLSSQQKIENQKTGGTPNASFGQSPPSEQTITFDSKSKSLGNVLLSEIKKVRTEKNNKLKSTGAAQMNSKASELSKGVLPSGTAKEQYTFALNLLRQTNYDLAEIALKEFLIAHKDDPLESNARYWLGETHYVRKSFRDAAQVFFEAFTKDPEGPKASGSLLKLGMSLAGFDKKEDACSTFTKVLVDFPKLSKNLKKEVARQLKRNSCP